MTTGNSYDFADAFIYGNEYKNMTNSLSQPVFLDGEDGKYIGVYPDGYVYYGEVENGMRSGEGYWFTVYKAKAITINTSWKNDAPNGHSFTKVFYKDYDYYETLEGKLVNGIYEGEWIQTVYEDNAVSHQWKYTCVDGKPVIISYEWKNIIAYCIPCTGIMYHTLSTDGNTVYSIPY